MTESVIASVNLNKNRKAFNVLDCASGPFINALGKHLKQTNLIKLPKWLPLIKTSHGNELSPLDADWFYYKAAAIVRQIYVSKSRNVGVGTLKTFFGRKKRNGVRPPKFIRSAGKIVRVIVRQLTPTFIEPLHLSTENTIGLGITIGGRAQLDKIANKVMKERSQ